MQAYLNKRRNKVPKYVGENDSMLSNMNHHCACRIPDPLAIAPWTGIPGCRGIGTPNGGPLYVGYHGCIGGIDPAMGLNGIFGGALT